MPDLHTNASIRPLLMAKDGDVVSPLGPALKNLVVSHSRWRIIKRPSFRGPVYFFVAVQRSTLLSTAGSVMRNS